MILYTSIQYSTSLNLLEPKNLQQTLKSSCKILFRPDVLLYQNFIYFG